MSFFQVGRQQEIFPGPKKRKPPSLPFKKYLKIKAVNWSTLKLMRESALHYKHAIDEGREDTAALARFRATHTAVLEPEKFEAEYPVFEGKTRRGADWDAFSALHAGRSILKLDERDEILRQRDAILKHPVAKLYLAGAEREVSVRWKDKTTGILCKGRIDAVNLERRAILDLKAGPTNARIFGRLAARMGYHNQSAFYADGYAAARGCAVFASLLIVYEPKQPYDVAVFRLRDEDVDAGRQENDELLNQVQYCRRHRKWPGRYVDEQLLELPSWVSGNDEDEDISGLGLEIAHD